MDLLKLKGSPLCRIHDLISIDFLVELIQDVVGDNRLKTVNNSVFVLFRERIFILITLDRFDSSIYVVAERHIYELKELIFVIICIKCYVHM